MPAMGSGPCSKSMEDLSDTPYFTLLTNGKGWVPGAGSKAAAGSAEVFSVKQGQTYRFRVIAGKPQAAPCMHAFSAHIAQGRRGH